ncbi:MAG TPA: BREX system ATP-binding domain-containing protein [Ktedonobacteraceae bacterium]|nr:BREX system ATP-binding domain-containing protein [Ktedonobacteraceae bacterium]
MQRHQGEAIPHHHFQTGASTSTLRRPPFVGRSAEMDRLAAGLERVARGQGGVMFLVGEAGIGKTRLAHEALILARERGFLVLEGSAYALEGRLAYAPILAALGPFLRRLDSPHQARLVSGLPDLGQLFTDLRLPAPSPLGDPALEKTRLFEAVARLLERLTRETPVLLFLDDLHWADPASIELLHYLTRGIADQAVLVLGTYRAEEIDTARGLRSLVMSLRRVGLVEEAVITRLEPEAVAALTTGVLRGEAPGELLALLNARAGGTPLFVEALITALIDAGQLRHRDGGWTLGTGLGLTLPSNVRDLILDRLVRLHLTERRVLDLIAVSGEAVQHDALCAASGLDDEVLVETVQRLRTTGLVIEDLSGAIVTYALTHPLIQEVAYAELPEMARRRAHAAFAAALERVRPEDLDRLARHYHAAGPQADPQRALEVLLAAGERAYALYANDQAARYFGAALTLIREGHRTELLPSVLEQLGEAWERVGETSAAIAVWSQARTLHERARNIPLLVRLQRRLTLAEWDRGHFDVAQAHLEAGFQALIGSEPSVELAELLHVQVILLGRRGDDNEVRTAAQNLATLAERLGSRRVLAEAYLAQARSFSADLDIAGVREVTQRALTEASLADEPLLVQRAHDLLALFAYGPGEHPLARHHAMLSLAVARQIGAPTLELYPRNRLISVDLMAGKWDEALHESAEVVALARRLGFARGIAAALGMRALVQVYRGDLNEAAACLAEAHDVFGGGLIRDRNIFDQIALAEMMLALERGDKAGALVLMERLNQKGGVSLLAQALVAEAQIMVGNPERALMLVKDFMAHAPLDNGFTAALGSRIKGLALQALGQPGEATACLDQAYRAFTAVEMPFDAARSHLEWATLVAATDRELAIPAVEKSLAVFERIGARRYMRRARSVLYKLGIRPRKMPHRSRGATPLSPRELEIVQLVADDLTTPEIAERLIISPRTVTTHLDRIYTRLGINSRTALVRYAIEGGLLPPKH